MCRQFSFAYFFLWDSHKICSQLFGESSVAGLKPAIQLLSNWRECKKMLAKWEKRQVYRWHFVNHLANHFSHIAFRRSHQTVGIFTKCQRGDKESFSSSFSQNQRWMTSAILWEVYSDWFAISRNSSRNSAWTCQNARNNKCIARLMIIENKV